MVRTAERPQTGASPADADPISLVLAARAGSRAAWEELVDRFTPLLWVVARGHRLSSEDAADAVQMTWLRCVERLDQIRDPVSIAAWLTTICRRESLGIVRRQSRARSDPIAEGAAIADPFATDAADSLIKQEERNILRERSRDCRNGSGGSSLRCSTRTRALTAVIARSPNNSTCRSAASGRRANAPSDACARIQNCGLCAITDVTRVVTAGDLARLPDRLYGSRSPAAARGSPEPTQSVFVQPNATGPRSEYHATARRCSTGALPLRCEPARRGPSVSGLGCERSAEAVRRLRMSLAAAVTAETPEAAPTTALSRRLSIPARWRSRPGHARG